MNTLIIYTHPSQNAYTFQILQHLKTALAQQAFNVTISDLYTLDFQSDVTKAEYENPALPVPADVLAEREKIALADCIIFLYPLWWSDCPAKLKGWFDRVFSAGYAYGHRDDVPKMKPVKQGIVICTAGHPNEVLYETGVAQSMETVMLGDRLGKRFVHKEMLLLGGTLELEKVRQLHRQQISELAERLKER